MFLEERGKLGGGGVFHNTGSSFIPVRLHPGSILHLYTRLHDTGSSFIPIRLHPGCILHLYSQLHDTASSFIPVQLHPVSYCVSILDYMITINIIFRYESFRKELITVVAPDRNVRSGTNLAARCTSTM